MVLPKKHILAQRRGDAEKTINIFPLRGIKTNRAFEPEA
ncbi:MAG: hypothetical protein [Olavius algarvensis Delta 4 endosymbiont]|nr:MAG: hypothetical protein [Olavius algarvensis Delta 4 endosymbiont]